MLVTRASVAVGDDVDAPHERAWRFPDGFGLRDVLVRIVRDGYLPAIAGGQAAWVVRDSAGDVLAVVAQQWREPRLVRERAGSELLGGRLHFDYLGPADPEALYRRLAGA